NTASGTCVYASGGQGHSPCSPRIREADADRFANEGGNLRKMKTKDKIVGGLGGLKTKAAEN
ncbi:MAG: hypothetical protein LBT64_01230, partial [Puniceicoccales bacterium]|nr:hypothetical protein [Puniceicoccales bacterium]